jgi:hypothetical protein
MSSLAAAKADNMYYPKDFDPAVHRTLNRFHGVHALRDRALADGGLVVRFEVPFALACARCGEGIAKGERFNAAKRQHGTYHSTKVWRFEMRHHCGSVIVVQTDPASADYDVVSGARRRAAPGRAQLGEAEEAGAGAASAAARLASDDALLGPVDAVPRDHAVGRERPAAAAAAAAAAAGPAGAAAAAAAAAPLLNDPMASLERSAAAQRRAGERASRLEALERRSAARHAPGAGLALNRALRERMRGARNEERGLEAERARMGVSEGVRLLPASRADGEGARRAMAEARGRGVGGLGQEDDPERRRRRILSEPIFGGGAAGGGGGGSVAAALAAQRQEKSKRPRAPEPTAPAAAPRPPAKKPAVAAWAPPLARGGAKRR